MKKFKIGQKLLFSITSFEIDNPGLKFQELLSDGIFQGFDDELFEDGGIHPLSHEFHIDDLTFEATVYKYNTIEEYKDLLVNWSLDNSPEGLKENYLLFAEYQPS